MHVLPRLLARVRMAKAPVKPLVAIVGATGTGKSDVGSISPRGDAGLGQMLITADSWP